MFTFNIEQWVPKFLLADKNGYAIAKAIEAGLNYMNDAAAEGIKTLSDYDTMPEWRLDELAWEYNLVYDYTAPVEIKRTWIKDAVSIYRRYGTAKGIIRYLTPYFDDAKVEEWWEYDADPFHFRVTIAGERTDAKDAWAQKAVFNIASIRSVLDGIVFEYDLSEAEADYAVVITSCEVVVHSNTL